MLLVLFGPPGSGKSTLAAALAARLGWTWLSSDLIRKRLAGVPPTARLDDEQRAALYRAEMGRRTYAALRRRATYRLKRGRSVVCDATFSAPTERDAMRRLAARLGVRLVMLECRTSESELRRRLTARDVDPTTVSDARLDDLPMLLQRYQPPTADERVQVIDTSRGVAAAVADVLALLDVED